MALVGVVAGVFGTLLAVLLATALSLDLPLARTLLVVPVALLLATIAGIVPAWRATTVPPMDAIRPSVLERVHARRVGGVISMASRNVLRVPSRTMLGPAGLVTGVATLTLLVSINRAFQGVLVGTLLGASVSVQVRGVDVASVLLVVVLGGFSIADVLFLNLKERQAEFVTLATMGWEDEHVRNLVLTEALAMGTMGSLVGVTLGVMVSGLVRGVPLSTIALAGLVAGVAGIAVVAAACLVPLATVQRLTVPTVLAEE